MLFREIFFICFGYLLGSILFARLFGLLFAHKDITQNTADGNPGTANAFLQGGFLCGVCTLLGDLFKGYLPVAWYLSTQNQPTVPPLAFALLIGRAGPRAHFSSVSPPARWKRDCHQLWLSACPAARPGPCADPRFFFLFFSCIVRISPHFYRTIVTYLCSFAALCFSNVSLSVRLGFLLITAGCLPSDAPEPRIQREVYNQTVMDALIFSCGTGGGHNSAANAVKQELLRRGHRVTMLDPYSLSNTRVGSLINQSYINLVKKAPRLFGLVYQLGNLTAGCPSTRRSTISII